MRLSRSVATRMITDIVLVNIGLLLAFSLRYIAVVASSDGANLANSLFRTYATQYAATSWVLALLTVGLFQGFGIYHQVRAYRQRFKAVVVVQAVALAHLAYGFIFYLITVLPAPPRGVVVLSWLTCTALLAGVRLARTMFRAFEESEQQKTPAGADKPRRVLVIGGAGYIGSLVLRRLLDQGYHVRLVDALLYGDGAIRDIYGHPDFEFVRGDFRHIETVVRSLVGMEAVIHLGAIVGDPACAIDEDFSTEINLIATRVLAEACKGYGIQRFVFASTCSVYGASDLTLDERSALNPVSLYARTKIDSEQVLLSMSDASFSPTILRFATIYGLSPRPRFDLVVNLLTAKAVREGKITVFGGDQWRPFVHVDDAAQAVILALQAPISSVKAEIFNVGSDAQNYTINQVGELIHRLIPSADLIQQGSDVDKRNYRVSFAKIARVLRFAPQHTVEDGVREIQAALEAGEIEDYYDQAFNNHKFLTAQEHAALIRLESPWAERQPAPRS